MSSKLADCLRHAGGVVHIFVIRILRGQPMSADKTNSGFVSIITLTFIGLKKHLIIGQLNEYPFFSVFHWSTSDIPPASQCKTEN